LYNVTLSGGGARGAIHLGVLHAFDEAGVKINAISGTSIGAIIGSLYCAGYSALEIKSFMDKKAFARVFKFSANKTGLLTMDKLIKQISELVPENSFDTLKIPFYSCVSNLDDGKFEILSSGDLYKSIVASGSIPIVFEPVLIDGKYYIDGGLFNNLPIEPFLDKEDKIIGVHVNNYLFSDKMTVKAITEKIFTQVIKQSVVQQKVKCDYFIEPRIDKNVGVLDFSETDYLFELGYNEAIKMIE
ncbi:MAG: patatin-like phospholipase family protein, partial [Flavobacteriales bacterium]|nr:patatin-like phospholipase family protein [Flavobacteriales bacterium]